MELVKENAALIDMWECCPFCRNEINGFVGLHAKQVADAVNPSSPLGHAGPRQLVSLSAVHRNVYTPAQMQKGSKIAEPLAAGAFQSGPAGANLYVFFCPDSWYDDELKQAFSVYGNVKSANIMKNSQGLSKGFGFVNFDNAASAQQAIQGLNGVEVGGRRLLVELKLNKG